MHAVEKSLESELNSNGAERRNEGAMLDMLAICVKVRKLSGIGYFTIPSY